MIEENENYSIQEEENLFHDNETVSEIITVNPEELNIYDSFFNGVTLAGTMLIISLGIIVILKIFNQSGS